MENFLKTNPHIARAPFKVCGVIKRLKEIFVIAPVDKAQHNLSLICKQYYLHVSSQELGSKAYSTVSNRTVHEILDQHKAFNKKYGHEHVDNIAYLYWIPKFHKNPPKPRFIAGVSNVHKATPTPQTVPGIFSQEEHVAKNSTTAASTYLSKQLQIVMKLLQEKDKKNSFKGKDIEDVGLSDQQRRFTLKSKPTKTI